LNNKWLMNTTAVVMHRRLAEVSSWAEMKIACGSMTSGTVTLSDGFIMGTYTPTNSLYISPAQLGGIDFSDKQLVIIGNNKVLEGGVGGRFFYGSGTGSSLEVHSLTMTNGKAYYVHASGTHWNGGAIAALSGANVEIYNSSFISNDAGGLSNDQWGNLGVPTGSSRGGAIYVSEGTVEIHDSTFGGAYEGNTATYGGAIAAYSGANVEIYTSIFQDNWVTNSQTPFGGAICADGANSPTTGICSPSPSPLYTVLTMHPLYTVLTMHPLCTHYRYLLSVQCGDPYL
jgi:hypothetical protein